MGNSENIQRRPRPVRTLLLSATLFLVLDTALFRSGLYVHLCGSPYSLSGIVSDIVHFNRVAASDAAHDVLLVGDSRTQWGFGTGDFENFFPNARIRPIMAASPGSSEEWWYYQLLAIDPHRNRYRAIVFPIAGYRINPWHSPWHEYKQDTYATAQALAPIIGLTEWPGFVMSFTDTDLRLRAVVLALFSSHDYLLDMEEFLTQPIWRMHWRAERNKIGQGWLRDDHGAPGDLRELTIDPRTRKPITYPERFDWSLRLETDQLFTAPSAVEAQMWTTRNAAFEARWLSRIIAAYRGSRTRLVFINIPHTAMPAPALKPIADAPDVRAMIPDLPNVTIVPENAFTALERPAFFNDMLHLNDLGHREFTRLLGQRLIALLAADSGAGTFRPEASE
jgi:hypothetical protein